MYCPYGGMMGGWGWFMMTAGTLLFIGLAALVVILLVRYTGTPAATPAPGGEAERLLAERYARGEIDDQEYQQRLGKLRQPHRPQPG